MIEVDVFIGHDNTFSLKLMQSGSPINLITTGLSRVVIKIGDILIDSDDDMSFFDWATDGSSGIIKFSLGSASITPYGRICRLILYDPSHTNGQVIEEEFKMHIFPQQVTE